MVLILFIFPFVSLTAHPLSFEDSNIIDIHSNEYIDHIPIIIVDNTDFSRLGFPGSGTSSNPFLIEGFNITNEGICISITETSLYFVIKNCYLKGLASNAVVSIEDVHFGRIESNIIEGGSVGLHINASKEVGVMYNMIAGAGDIGIHAVLGQYLDITGNNVFANEIGIRFSGTEHSSIVRNRVYSNSQTGIEFEYETIFNDVFRNSIGWNVGPLSLSGERNAEDDGQSNTWNDNSWSNYRMQFGSVQIPGDALSQDSYPASLIDFTRPVITSPVGSPVVQGDETASLNWTIVEEFPFSYEVYQDGEIVEVGYLTMDIITRPLESLPIGDYNFTLLIREGVGIINTHEQIVRVVYSTNQDTVLSAIGGISLIVIVIVIWEKKIRHQRS